MLSLMFALLASPTAESQAVQAALQSCALEGERYVCRYAVPDIVIVPVPGSNITAEAPAAVLGSAPSADGAAATPSTTTTAVPATTLPYTAVPSAPAPTAVDAGPIRPIDAGVLTEREAQLVARCADAGWVSLCLPDDRRAARTLRDKQDAYLAVRRDVTRLLGEERCDAAVRAALDGGYLALARETRDYCAAPATSAAAAAAPVGAESAASAGGEPAAAKSEDEAEG